MSCFHISLYGICAIKGFTSALACYNIAIPIETRIINSHELLGDKVI